MTISLHKDFLPTSLNVELCARLPCHLFLGLCPWWVGVGHWVLGCRWDIFCMLSLIEYVRCEILQTTVFCCVVWLKGANSLEEPSVSIFRVEELVPVYQTRWFCIPEDTNLEWPAVFLSKLLLTYTSIWKVSDSSVGEDTKVYYGFHQSIQQMSG